MKKSEKSLKNWKANRWEYLNFWIPLSVLTVFLLAFLLWTFYLVYQNFKESWDNNNEYWQEIAQIEWENTPKGFSAWELVESAKDGQIVIIQGRLISYKGNSYYEFEDPEKNTFLVRLDSKSDFNWNQIKRNQLIELTAKTSTEDVNYDGFNKTTKRILVGISAIVIEK